MNRSPIEALRSRFSPETRKKKNRGTVGNLQRKLRIEQLEQILPLSGVGDDAPTAYWAMEQQGDTVEDMTGGGYDGVNVGGEFSSDKPENLLGSSGSMRFDGTGEHVNLGDLRLAERDVTVSAWVKPDDVNGGMKGIITKRMFGNVTLAMGIANEGKIYMGLNNGQERTLFSTGSITAEEWTHVTGVYDSGKQEIRIYFNGVLDTVVSGIGNGNLLYSGERLMVGVLDDGKGGEAWHYGGEIDDLGLWNRVLTNEEVVLAGSGVQGVEEALQEQENTGDTEADNTEAAVRAFNPDIPYSRMRVEGFSGVHRNFISVLYATPLDAVTFRLYEGTSVVNIPVECKGGTADGSIGHIMPSDLIGEYSRNPDRIFTFDMLDSEGNVLDRVQIRGNGSIMTGQDAWEDMETGRSIEFAIEPRIQVAAINGTAVVFAASTPYDNMTVTMSGGGLMSQRSFEREGGTEVLFGQTFFDASNPAGEYALTLTNNKGMVLDQVTLKWDGELSLTDAADRWSSEGQVAGMLMRGDDAVLALAQQTEQLAGVTDAVAAQTGLKSMNVDDYPVLREFQEDELWRASQFHKTREEMDEAYFIKNPAMRNPETDQLRTMRSDTLGALWEDMDDYGTWVGRILDRAVNVYFISQRGGGQQAAIQAVQTEIDIAGGLPKILELQIGTGVKLPTLGQALAEGLKIYEENVDIFYSAQGMSVREFVKQESRASDPYWQIVYGGQSPGADGGVLVAS
ncbi:MAG: LamG domain-containing protein, partial [Patescibacteria group bacterium]